MPARRCCRGVIDHNADEGVTWVHSYVSADKHTTFCIYDGPTPEAIRKTAARNTLPVDQITEVRVLVPVLLRVANQQTTGGTSCSSSSKLSLAATAAVLALGAPATALARFNLNPDPGPVASGRVR